MHCIKCTNIYSHYLKNNNFVTLFFLYNHILYMFLKANEKRQGFSPALYFSTLNMLQLHKNNLLIYNYTCTRPYVIEPPYPF